MLGANRFINIVQKLLSLFLLLSLFALGASFFLKQRLADQLVVSEALQNEPVQDETKSEKFTFSYRGANYNVRPLADYELWGLVVAHNDINAWFNYYHDKNSVNLKDICVIWGNNAEKKVWQAMNFKSGEWTCYPKYKRPVQQEIIKEFQGNQLSNNHLLSSDLKIQEQIRNLRIGDQVHLKGMLVSYGKEGIAKKYYRSSSLNRSDTGNGACETFFVNELEIYNSGNEFWYQIFYYSQRTILLLIILKVLLLIFEASFPIRTKEI